MSLAKAVAVEKLQCLLERVRKTLQWVDGKRTFHDKRANEFTFPATELFEQCMKFLCLSVVLNVASRANFMEHSFDHRNYETASF